MTLHRRKLLRLAAATAAAQALPRPALAQAWPNRPIKVVVPVGFALLGLQGLSELIKRIAMLQGYQTDVSTHYERPLQ